MANELYATPYGRHIIGDHPIEEHYRKYEGQDLTGKSLLLCRSGGYGDLLFLSPLIRHLRKKYDCKISVITAPRYAEVFFDNPDVNQVWALPFPTLQFIEYDYHLHFEGTIEASKDAQAHAVDVFAAHAGVELGIGEKTPIFNVAEKSWKAARNFLRNELQIPWKKKMVAIQPKASAILRSIPPTNLAAICRKLTEKGILVLMLGAKDDFPDECKMEGVFDLCGAIPSIAMSVAVLSHCHLLIAPDSAMTHFAAAIGKPTIALYGPFPGEIRTKYYPRCVTIEPPAESCDKMPCMIHSQAPCPAAQKNGDCYSPCLAAIGPDRIANLAMEMLP
jgi:ADP-heptose:LPS heptosyltransferase